MNIRITTILIVLTLLFGVIFFYFFAQDSKITDLIVTQDPLNTAKTEKIFSDKSHVIFLLIKLNKVKKGEKIKISWFRNNGENNLLLIQDSVILTDSPGSGFLQISLLDKNGNYESGNYQIKVSLNGNLYKPLDFQIN